MNSILYWKACVMASSVSPSPSSVMAYFSLLISSLCIVLLLSLFFFFGWVWGRRGPTFCMPRMAVWLFFVLPSVQASTSCRKSAFFLLFLPGWIPSCPSPCCCLSLFLSSLSPNVVIISYWFPLPFDFPLPFLFYVVFSFVPAEIFGRPYIPEKKYCTRPLFIAFYLLFSRVGLTFTQPLKVEGT